MAFSTISKGNWTFSRGIEDLKQIPRTVVRFCKPKDGLRRRGTTYIPVVTIPTFALLLVNQKLKPVHSRKIARNGKVKSRRFRRPHRSIVNTAGSANTQLRMPVPIDASNAEVVE